MGYNFDLPSYKDISQEIEAIKGIPDQHYRVDVSPYEFSVTTTTYDNTIPLVVGLVVGGGALFCLIVICCCCCKRTTRGRVLVPSPGPATSELPPVPNITINNAWGGGAAVGSPQRPMGQASQPVVAPYVAGTNVEDGPEYPPSYDTDRLLHGNAKAQLS